MADHMAEIIVLGDIHHFREECDECHKGIITTVTRKVYETACCFEDVEKVLGKTSWYWAGLYCDFYRNHDCPEEYEFWVQVVDLLQAIEFGCLGAIRILPDEIAAQSFDDSLPF